MGKQPFKKVLIANRGEIAVRIIRTLRDLGLQSVAIYSDADHDSNHRFLADEAVRIPGNSSAETYLHIERIMAAVAQSGAQAVHPGYGFLSENADFAEVVTKAGYKFIGPSSKAMRLLGDKVEAKKLMIKNDIAVTPGSEGGLSHVDDLRALVKKLGYPLILKAAAGGGGRGMRVVRKDEQLESAFDACSREALSYFGNAQVFAEKFIENPRHIEVQVLCDSHGQGFHLSERDCSVQRRHQKLIEEAPSVFLDADRRKKLGEVAVRAALAAGYEGVGTVEFICESPDEIYFMEVNTRIQVEHTVTEAITQTDLVAEQIKVAQGEKLTWTQDSLQPRGWAIECRINAEDALQGFIPSPGKISKLRLPQGPHIRVDSHIYEGYQIPTFYDSMIAKLIVWGPDRDSAIRRMARALSEMIVEGVPTTARFHEAVLGHKEFIQGKCNTGFIEKCWQELKDAMQSKSREEDPLAALLVALMAQEQQGSRQLPVNKSRKSWQQAGRLEATNRH